MDKVIKDHSKLMILSSLLGFQSFMGPILVLFYTKYIGLTFSQYCFLDSILFLMIAVFEIPSGYLADSIGRKRMLLISQVLTIISMVILVLFPSYIGAFVSIIISGIFIPLGSGNSDAIFFETFKKAGNEQQLQDLYAKCGSISFGIAIIISILSGFLAQINLAIPVIIDTTLLVMSFISNIIFLHDDKLYLVRKIKETPKGENKIRAYTNNIKKLLNVTPFFIIMAVIFGILRGSYSFYQPLFDQNGISIKYYGIIFALFSIVSAIASRYSSKILRKINSEFNVLILFAIILTLSVTGMVFFNSYIIILFICMQQIVRGFYAPFFSMQRNYYIPETSHNRVTYLSYANLLSTLIVSLTLTTISILNSNFNLTTSMEYFGIISISLLIISSLTHYILKKKGVLVCYQAQQLST